MRLTTIVIAVAALAIGLSVHAAQVGSGGVRYRWVDAQGLPHFSDSLTDDAIKYGYDVINDQGLVVGHVQKQLSPAERAAAAKQAAQQEQQRQAQEQRVREDRQLLNAYPDEASFKAAQQDALNSLDQQIKTTEVNLQSQEKALADLLARAAEIERSNQPVPKFIGDGIAKQRNVVANQRAALARQQTERDATVQQQAQDLAHYRDLKAAQKDQRGY